MLAAAQARFVINVSFIDLKFHFYHQYNINHYPY